MSQNSIDQKSKSSSDNDICSFSDSEEDNSGFFSKTILFQPDFTKEKDKDKNNHFLLKSSKSINDEIKKTKSDNRLYKSNVNICLEKDNSYNNIKDIENKNTSSSYITKDSNPKKKTLSLLLLGKEKTKIPTKKIYIFEKTHQKKEEEKPIRTDKNGTIINKKNKKKVKISFNSPFENVEYIESFKKYNAVYGSPKNDVFIRQQDNCQCCQIW